MAGDERARRERDPLLALDLEARRAGARQGGGIAEGDLRCISERFCGSESSREPYRQRRDPAR
jgi:hypothetical protein